MADETLEQAQKHRDQLKAENDHLNPLVDQLKKQLADAAEALRLANELIVTAKAAADAKTAHSAELEMRLSKIVELAKI